MGNSRSKKYSEVHQISRQNEDELLEQNAGTIVEHFSSQKILIWEIRDFFAQQNNHPQLIKRSPLFCFGGETWYLLAFPNGTGDCPGYIVLSLILIPLEDLSSTSRNDFFSGRIHWKLRVKHHDNLIFKTSKGKRHFKDWKDNGYEEESLLLEPSEIPDKKSFSPDGSLTVICELRVEEEQTSRKLSTSSHTESIPIDDNDGAIEVKSDEPSGTDKLAHDLERLLRSGEDSDVTIEVEGQEFKAHRNILRARTPVIASMFKDEMTGNTTSVVSIDDCDAGTFQEFLLYVYTGTVENLSPENVFGLYELANSYQVDELKAECVRYVKHALSVGTFCDVITFASRHDEHELTKLAMDFYSDNMEEIMMSVKWQIFREGNPTRAKELLMKALAREG